MEFSFENSSPVYLQMADQLEAMVVSGQFEPGMKLPSVRELAMISKTNPNTVSKALAELERKGLIETRRTSGKYVARQDERIARQRMISAQTCCKEFVSKMTALGFTHEQIRSLLERSFDDASEY